MKTSDKLHTRLNFDHNCWRLNCRGYFLYGKGTTSACASERRCPSATTTLTKLDRFKDKFFWTSKNTNHLWRQSRKQLSYRETILIGLENNLVITIGFFLRLNCRFFPQQRSSLGYPGRLWLCVKKSLLDIWEGSCAPVHEAGRGFAVACLHNRASSREEPLLRTPEGAVPYLFIRNFLYRVLKIRR